MHLPNSSSLVWLILMHQECYYCEFTAGSLVKHEPVKVSLILLSLTVFHKYLKLLVAHFKPQNKIDVQMWFLMLSHFFAVMPVWANVCREKEGVCILMSVEV